MSAVLDSSSLFRSMTPEDLDTVARIEAEGYGFPWTRGIFYDCLQAGYECVVRVEQGCVIAYGVMAIGPQESHILNLCVATAAQRRGVGRALLGHLLDLARDLRCHTAFLEVRASNYHAQSLYIHAGFSEIGTRERYYPAADGREDAIVFARLL